MGRPPTDGDIQKVIIELVEAGQGTTHILQKLAEDPRFQGRVPDLRTVQRIVSPRRRKIEGGGPWHISDSSPAEARTIAEVMAAMIRESGGTRSGLTKDDAAWILRIRAVAPAMPPVVVWRFAREYLLAGSGSEHLDASLAVAGQVEPLPSGEFRLDPTQIAAHVKVHVDRWIARPLVVWAGSLASAKEYINQIGRHASLVLRKTRHTFPTDPYTCTEPKEGSWFDKDYFGRLIIDSSFFRTGESQ